MIFCEMCACHLLLGRPWQYDVKDWHEGETNVHHITKGVFKYTMNPLLEEMSHKIVKGIVMLVGEKEFM